MVLILVAVLALLAGASVLLVRRFLCRQRLPAEARPYRVNTKLITIGIFIEIIVASAEIMGVIVVAVQSGNDTATRAIVIAGGFIFAAFEIARIPCAIAARTQESRFWRTMGVLAVCVSATLSGIGLISVNTITVEPRLQKVHEQKAELEKTRAVEANFAAQLQTAKDDVAARLAIYHDTQSRAQSSGSDLAHQRNVGSKSGAATESLIRANFRQANNDIATARKELEAAKLRLAQLDPAAGKEGVQRADMAYRQALSASQLHLLAGAMFGIDASKVSDDQVGLIKRIVIVAPAILAALIGSLVSMLAVTPIRRAGTDIPDVLGVVKSLQAKTVQLHAALKTANERARVAADKRASDEPAEAAAAGTARKS